MYKTAQHLLPQFGILCLLWTATCAYADNRLDAQRQAFRERYAEAELGIWHTDDAQTALLKRYVLWPDLRAAYLRATMRTADDGPIHEFLQTYGSLKPARELRYQYALYLARSDRDAEFLDLYAQHYADIGVARLDCHALAVEMKSTSPADVLARARPLWLVGKNQARECDPVFDALRSANLLDESLYAERYALAVDNRELAIARYLSRSLPEDYRREAGRWTEAYGAPDRFLQRRQTALDSATYRRQLRAAVEQIAYKDPQTAFNYWRELSQEFDFSDDDRAKLSRHTALWLARYHKDNAYAELSSLSGAAVDDEVRRWLVRTSLRQYAWKDVADRLGELSTHDRNSPQWQYWTAQAMQQLGNASARAIFLKLAEERSYYGFLAADTIGVEYNFGHSDLEADDTVLKRIEKTPAFERARELFMTGLDGRGRSEWDAAVRTLTADEQVQAAILAHRWGWHSRAIATAAQTGQYDDLDIRYPLPLAETFTEFSLAASIRLSWAYGIARSESLFMRDIRSSAGAIGVMQLTPSTGKITARELNYPYAGTSTLTDASSNIRLGTWHLGRMQTRFFDNPVLATAAYNAGPLRVDAWLPDRQPLDAAIWIETIPYAETRDYVRRVLTAETIFSWRLDGKAERMSSRMPEVQSADGRLAANRRIDEVSGTAVHESP